MSRPKDERKLASRLASYAFWLMTVLGAALGVALLVQDHHSPLYLKLSAVGAGLLSAVVFSAFVTIFVNRESKLVLSTELRILFAEQSKVLMDSLNSTSRHLPTNEYPPTDQFDSAFMQDFIRDLQQSSGMHFRGSTAKWVAPYANYCRKAFSDIQVLMLDPSNATAIRRRAADRHLIRANAGKSLYEIEEETRHEACRTLVALFDLRVTGKVRVALDGTLVSVVRLERTDEAIYVALYHASTGHSTVNPTTYRYARNSLAFHTYSLELSRQLEIAPRQFLFERDQTDADLQAVFAYIGMAHIGSAEIDTLRAEAKVFEKRFFANMNKVNT